MANNRIFYASQAIALQPNNAELTGPYGGGAQWYFPRGVQSVGISTNFGLEQVFQLGQIDLYENVEDVPEIEVTINKVIDGTPPLYLLCMGGTTGIAGASGKELVNLANNRVGFKLAIYDDTSSAATGTPVRTVTCPGMYLSSVSYTIPVDGNATEDVTLVGNNKVWTQGGMPSLYETANRQPMTAPAIGRRYKYDKGSSVQPSGMDSTRIQSITISTDLGREAINELGSMAPYFRYVNFPVEVTAEYELTATSGDGVEASDFTTGNPTCNTSYRNLSDETVKVVMCGSGVGSSLTIDLGTKNKLTSVNYTGGDTGGGNATVTYSYQTFNKLVVTGAGTFGVGGDDYVDMTNDGNVIGD